MKDNEANGGDEHPDGEEEESGDEGVERRRTKMRRGVTIGLHRGSVPNQARVMKGPTSRAPTAVGEGRKRERARPF